MRALMIGAGMALAAGMTMGFSMQPRLDVGGERPQGPQQFAQAGGVRSTGPFDPGTSYSYNGQIPDYVTGTDWKKAASYAAEPAPHRASREDLKLASSDELAAPMQSAPAEPPSAPVSYPSISGGERYGAGRPAVPAQSDDAPPTFIG